MFHSIRRRSWGVVFLTAVMLLGATSVAVGYFTAAAGGGGKGAASVGSSSPFTVGITSDPSGALYPGSGSETLTYTILNPSAGHESLLSTSASVASVNGDITQSGVEVKGCLASWFAVANTPPAGLPVDLAGAGSLQGSVLVTLDDANVDQDACQGAKPDILVQAS